MNHQKSLASRILIYLIPILVAGIYTLKFGTWPKIYLFSTEASQSRLERLVSAPIHLADDVMISLRAGHILNETGIPAFNREDIAQPSTSYLSPYLFALVSRIAPENIAVGLYSALGFAAVLLTLLTLIAVSKSKSSAALLAIALALTTTNTSFALHGWDHLFQALFLAIATAIALRSDGRAGTYLCMSLCLALGSLSRPDGVLIAAAVIGSAYLTSRRVFRTLFYGVAPFALIVGWTMIFNLIHFGYLTPTTARLKIGASPSMEYSLNYFVLNGLLSFSAITILILAAIYYLANVRLFDARKSLPILLGCAATGLFAFLNSDFFAAGRMYWSAACVLSIVIAMEAPAILRSPWHRLVSQDGLSTALTRIVDSSVLHGRVGKLLAALVAVSLLGTAATTLSSTASNALVRDKDIQASSIAQQFRVTKWIEANLDPADGAIGFYWLGVSYHLPRFEIADFLGKADEMIANTRVRWGTPGHNKWDTDKTLEKWDLQAIVPADNSDYTFREKREAAEKALRERRDYAFIPDLLLNEAVQARFRYCYLRANPYKPQDTWGFYLRKDLAQRHQDKLSCRPE